VTLVACGGSHGAGVDGGGGGGGGGGDGGASCAEVCAGDACGSNADCACADCHYDVAPVGSGGGPVVYAAGANTLVFGATVATRAGSTWTYEQVPDLVGGAQSLAIASDGTRWLSTNGGGALHVYHGAGSAWAEDELDTSAAGGQLAIAADGSVVVAWSNATELRVARAAAAIGSGSAGFATTTALERSDVVGATGVALDPTGAALGVAWTEPQNRAVRFATLPIGGGAIGSASAVQTVDDAAPSVESIAVVIDAGGVPHVAYRHSAPEDRGIFVAQPGAGSAWQLDEVDSQFDGTDFVVHLAVGSGGAAAVLYDAQDGLALAQHVAGSWLAQPITGDCSLGGDVAYDAGGTLHVADGCSFDGAVDELVRGSDYPSDHAATCTDAATELCTAACSCGDTCTIDDGDGSIGEAPLAGCIPFIAGTLCRDATLPATAVVACEGDAGSAACGSDGDALAPGSCPL
jgi:hypothetical protein